MVVVCGEALIDVIRARDGAERSMPGGGPFNTARALARLGVPVAFFGHLSDDEDGRELSRLLAADGVSLALATAGREPTTRAVAELDAEGQARYTFEVKGTSAPQLTSSAIPERLPGDVTAVYAGSLGLALEPMASTVLDLVERRCAQRVVIIDPNVRPGLVPDVAYRRRLRRAMARSTIVKASEADLEFIFPGVNYRAAAGALLRDGVALVAVTLGESGAFGMHRDYAVSATAAAVKVVDTIGAGDAFGAGLVAWLHDRGALSRELRLSPDQLQAALEYASTAAAMTCSRAGADPPWKREMTAPA